ncbi:unnamed protein product [Timema podura]|uniref:VWFD domain-containing protein n=1 Tax=Timema podura TaxID=61482 RepID=A0ABN7P4T4_TIMPD|nr:unnamed protein product [Timema podura]
MPGNLFCVCIPTADYERQLQCGVVSVPPPDMFSGVGTLTVEAGRPAAAVPARLRRPPPPVSVTVRSKGVAPGPGEALPMEKPSYFQQNRPRGVVVSSPEHEPRGPGFDSRLVLWYTKGDGVCTVFGDPHYRTFDGKLYSFQGSCKYLLTADCVGHTFNIRVTNNARTTKTSSWTKTISIKVGEIKVNLGQKMRVKLNGKRIEPPYSYGDHIVINKTDDSIVVYTKLGIKILWDGNSFLEVSAPTSYKGKLCGLCGNFNNKKRDDFANRQGRLVSNPERFGLAWRVGGKKACTRPQDEFYRGPQCVARLSSRFDRDSNLCKKLRKSSTFGACHGKVHPTMYIE